MKGERIENMTTYQLMVSFERDFDEDCEWLLELEKTGKISPSGGNVALGLAKLFAWEMQGAYDDCALSGEFQVNKVQLPDKTIKIIKEITPQLKIPKGERIKIMEELYRESIKTLKQYPGMEIDIYDIWADLDVQLNDGGNLYEEIDKAIESLENAEAEYVKRNFTR